MEYTIKCDMLDIKMVVKVLDKEKFEAAMTDTNKFWGGDDYRAMCYGGHVLAGLKMFAQECFQQIAFNNFLDPEWLKCQFDWSQKFKGIEGFSDFDSAGLEVTEIESWFICTDEIEINLKTS